MYSEAEILGAAIRTVLSLVALYFVVFRMLLPTVRDSLKAKSRAASCKKPKQRGERRKGDLREETD